ncbi:hypothetical protein [Streptomyces coeruleorubidus]|uniref:Helix-turn-helix domain-containing protein n=1 Tax=Streptomyces coeruleorubidus TaxID=116188 RepID=A0ABZ0KTL7_STRC4|nr:hypothetical protein [Streptomyces coeruleorubidus]WOT40650.1 hypothetical protein R5U08_41915 [Streptomyces coeruleorubidus]
MSGVAASAALTGNTRGGVPRRRLRSVPTQAGPVAERGPAHRLALGRDAQARFRGAVRALLDAPGLEGMSDAVRLAVIVLASRTASETGVVEIRTPELGRWLGLSASYVASEVVPTLRRSGVVDVETAPGEYGQDIGLKCKVLPMWTGRGVVGHPLALAKKELATLLRLLEAVMAPGWAHWDGRVTPAGLLGSRTGRAAATDRLALLLLVLEAREDGRVRQCGGTVDTRRGRAAATVARLLGCTVSRGERVLERLEDRDLVVRVRVGTASGLCHRTRLVVPAVAAAHGRDRIANAGEDPLKAAEPEFSDPALAAGGSDASGSEVDPQVNGAPVADEADTAHPALTAALHTDHPPVVTPVSSLALSCGCSGEGRGAKGRRPECACVREDKAANDGTDVAESAPPVAKRGPLRGEKPKKSPVDEQDGQRAAGAVAGGRPKAAGWVKAQQQLRVGLPADLGLRVALGPVAGLWERLSGWQQDQVEAAARAELSRLAGMLERPEMAPQLLADRLTDRLEETGGEALVDRPFPWLIRRGLVQRQACSDRRCDDRLRLDTGGECENCGNVLHLRRARRAKIAAEVDRELPGLGARERRQVLEERLREHTQREAEQAGARHDQAVAEVEMRRAAAGRRRAAEEAAALERRAAACVECGLPGAAGLCPECTYRRRTDALVQEAVDLAVAVRADLDDPAQIADLSERCEADTRALVDDGCRRQADQGLVAFTAREVAERVRDERRASAHSRLMRSEEAEAEAEAVYDTVLRCRPRGHQAAEEAAEEARRRTARYLLDCRLGQLQAQRVRMRNDRAPERVG